MSAHGATRRRAFEVACALAAIGKRPTIAAVREGLDGKGSQQAIGAGIDDWLDEAARRFQIPGIPEALRTQVVEVWDQACRLAGERWFVAKTALEVRVSDLDAQLAAVTGERDAARTEFNRLDADLNSQGMTLRETQDALDLARNTLAARTEALQETTEALAQARVQGEDQARQRDHAERVAAASAESLKAAQERIARLQVEQEVATARAELLERAEATAQSVAAQARGDLDATQSLVYELRKSLSERDGQLAALTSTVQSEQQSRDADTQHWLARIEELQLSVADHRAREAAWVEERKGLATEVQRLGQDVRRVRAPCRTEVAGAG